MLEGDIGLKGIEKACAIFIEEADKVMKTNEESEFVWAGQGLSTGQSMVNRFRRTSDPAYQKSCEEIYQRLEDKKSELNKVYQEKLSGGKFS